MKIHTIGMLNFKGFSSTPEGEEITIDLGGKTAVFYGINGAGKTTILSAASYAFWPLLKKINISQGKDYQTMSADLLHIGKRYKNKKICEVKLQLDDCGKELYLAKGFTAQQNGSVLPINSYSAYTTEAVEYFTENYLSDEEAQLSSTNCKQNMPVILNYGTNRSVFDIPIRATAQHSFSKRSALDRALESKLDFRTFYQWYRNQEDIENEKKNENYKDPLLSCVRKAIMNMMDDFEDIRIRRSPLRMVVIKKGKEFRIEQLSEGEKCTLSLLGDIARRVAMANPCRENPLEGDGIIMIDEIDLHLHPAWQRKILGVLKKTFPNIQFIVTTHSPQILGEVDDNCRLFSVTSDGLENHEIREMGRFDCFDSNYILENYMDTSPENAEFRKRITNVYRLIDHNEFDSAQKEIDTLTGILGVNHSEILSLTAELIRSRYHYEKNHQR